MSLKKNVIANYFGQGWTALMGLAFVPLYIKYLGIEAYGMIGIFALLQSWLVLLDMGMTPTLSREMARYTGGAHTAQSILDLLRSIEIVAIAVACLIAVGIGAASTWLATDWLHVEKLPVSVVAQAFGIMGVVAALRFIEGLYRSILVGLQRQVLFIVVNAVMSTLRWLGAVVVLAWVSPTLGAFFLWQGLVSILTVCVFVTVTYRVLPRAEHAGRFSWAALKNVGRFAGGMVGITFLSLLLMQVDKLLLSRLVSLKDFGYYTLAASVASALYFLVTPIVTAFSPHLTELVARSEQQLLVDSYHRASQWLAVALIPAALVIAAFSEPLLYVWTGNVILSQKAGPFLVLLVLGTLCNGFMNVPYMTQLAHGWTSFAVRVNIIAVVIIIPAILLTVPRFGGIAAAWAWLVLNAGYVLIAIPFMHRRLLPYEKWRWYWNAVFKPLLIGSITVLMLRYWIVLPQGRVLLAATLAGIALLMLGVGLCAVPASRAFLWLRWETFRGRLSHD